MAGALGGDRPDVDSAFALVYEELRRIARREMARERPGHTLQTTALVNEAYLKLKAQRVFAFRDDPHFLALAARAMRQVLIDCARKKNAARRSHLRVDLDLLELERTGEVSPEDFLTLNEILDRLAVRSPNGPRQVRLIELVYLTGLDLSQAAKALAISRRQAQRDWAWARTWLARELSRA